MARNAKIWWRKDRRSWFTTIDGKQINLGADKKAGTKLFHKLMSERNERQIIWHDSVIAIVDSFLDWTLENRAKTTYDWYLTYLESFCKTVPTLRVDELRPKYVTKWITSNKWSDSTKKGAITCVKRCFSWAVKEGHIEKSPVAHMEKPEQGKRQTIVTAGEYDQIVARATDQPFIDLLTFAWESGARPQECYRVEDRHFDEKLSRLVFPKENYLNKVALSVVKRNLHGGHLFLNQDGIPFDKNSVNCRFLRLKKHMKKKFCIYQFRHSFTTRMLEAGVDPLTLAILLGHANPAILSTTYQHLAFNPENLLSQLEKAS